MLLQLLTMNTGSNFEGSVPSYSRETRSHSAQGLPSFTLSSAVKIPLPPRMWITDIEDESSDGCEGSVREDEVMSMERARVRSRFRHYKQRSSIPIGIFWDIENCQVPRGCSAIDVVAAIRAKFLTGRREADFVVVCDVRKESTFRLQELNDAQISLIHVCGTQKNAADEKLRQCMRRFGELHSAPAALLLISGDINFAADLSDFRHRKNMEVILVHKRNTSSALIACASSHYCYNELTAHLPRNPKTLSQTEDDEVPTCEMEVANLPLDQTPERVSRRLRRLADNCGGKVLKVHNTTAVLRFPTPDHASRALKRMDGEDVFGRKISTRYARSVLQPTYSSDEGYSTAPAPQPPPRSAPQYQAAASVSPVESAMMSGLSAAEAGAREWALALQALPPPEFSAPNAPTARPRQIRGTHGSSNLDRSGCSSSNSGDDSRRELSQSRAVSPWNCSGSFSEQSEGEESMAELTVTNLPPYDFNKLQELLIQLFSKYVPIVRVSVYSAADGPLATVVLRSEWDARLAIARIHKKRLENQWTGRRLELSLGRPSPAPNLDVLKARLRAILLDQKNHNLPLVRLRDAYASRHCCPLTSSDLAKVKDTVMVHDGFGRMVQLIDLTPVNSSEMEEAPWKCHIHAGININHEDGSRILQPVFMEINALAKNVQVLLQNHGGILPLLSFVECYEATFPPLCVDGNRGVALELLLRSIPALEVKDTPSRHLAWRAERPDSPPKPDHLSDSSRGSGWSLGGGAGGGGGGGGRTAPALEPMLALFERELLDLLRSAPRCTIAFSKLIPAFHHHFGRQCRVADYGFTKLPDLLAALSNTIVVLGSGSSRVITISAAAQARRWTSDLTKLLKAAPSRTIQPHDIPLLYQSTFNKPFATVDYGVCYMGELMQRINPQAVVVTSEGSLSLPRRMLTSEERARTLEFARQAIEILCYTPNLRMEFARFVPAYHAHFGRQLRVANYGCVKLLELFELIPEAVAIGFEVSGERNVHLAVHIARAVMAERLQVVAPTPLSLFPTQYASQFGAVPLPEILDVSTMEELVYASGGSVELNIVRSGEESTRWANAMLAACATLAGDRSVAPRSTQEYFESSFRHIVGSSPQVRLLTAAGVVERCAAGLQLSGAGRALWRLACAAHALPRPAPDLYHEYAARYDITHFDIDSMLELLRTYRLVFSSEGGLWSLRRGVSLPRLPNHASADYAAYDTPPGHKGSRVFDSPKVRFPNVWCSPPASDLPTPTALLSSEKRRTRLAAHFDAA